MLPGFKIDDTEVVVQAAERLFLGEVLHVEAVVLGGYPVLFDVIVVRETGATRGTLDIKTHAATVISHKEVARYYHAIER